MSTLLASPRLAFLKKDSYMARLVIVFLILLIFFAAVRPGPFFAVRTWQSMAVQFPEFGLMSLGVMFTMFTAGIDLSVVAIANVTSICAALTLRSMLGPAVTPSSMAMATLIALGVALTVGDPAADDADVAQAVRDFADFATDAGLIPALYSVHAPAMEAARAMGWTIMQVAEEAVLDLPDLAFRGKAYQDVRTALNHANKEGIEAVWTTFRDCPAGRRDQIRAISQAWASDKPLPEMGFTLGGLAELDDAETRLLLAVDAEGTVQGVTSWLPVYRDGRVIGLTLDFMRRREGGFRPVMEYLIGRAAQDAQAEGLEILSLSGAPLSRSAPADGDASSRFDPLLNLLASVLEPAYGFGSLHAYKRKFKPRSVPMYLAVPDLVDLPTVGIAIARAYLPGLKPSQTARFAHVLMNRD